MASKEEWIQELLQTMVQSFFANQIWPLVSSTVILPDMDANLVDGSLRLAHFRALH